MEGFTEAETAYIALLKSVQATLPDASCSVKNNPLRTKEDLANSLVYFMGQTYQDDSYITTAHPYVFGRFAASPRRLNGTEELFSLTSTSGERERIRMMNTVLEHLMRYLPDLRIKLPDSPPFWKTKEAEASKAKFLRHLDLNRERLLRGPPHATEHRINPRKAEEWVMAQINPERQRLARILLQNLRYISHPELLEALRSCVEPTARLLTPEKPVIFFVGKQYKSNYYISLLFVYFWLQAGHRLDGVFNTIHEVESLDLAANFLDVDDMSYSGNQTMGDLSRTYRSYANSLRDHVKSKLESNPDYQRSYMVLPRSVIEQTLQASGFRYIVVRAFMSDSSYKRLTSEEGLRIPIQVVTHERILYLPGVSEQDKRLIEYTFSTEPPNTTVYFNHKVADPPSTYLYVVAQGVVPERMLVLNDQSKSPDPAYLNGVEGNEARFLPFVEQCGTDPHVVFPSRSDRNFWDVPERYRCPYAWYKDLNWNTPSGGRRKTRKTSHSKSVSHRNFGSRARQNPKPIARSSRGSRTGFRRRASKKS